MAESREDAQAEILEVVPIESEADETNTSIDEVPSAGAAASDSPLTASSWGPPELEGYTVHGPGLDDRPRLSWTARHAGADLYFIDVRFAGEPRQSIGPLPASEVVRHIAAREAQARRAYDEIAARFSGRPSVDVPPVVLAAAEAPWPPVIIPSAPMRTAAPAPAEPLHPEPVIAAQPAATDLPPEAEQAAPMAAVAPEPIEGAAAAESIESATAAMAEPSAELPAGPSAPKLLRASGVIGAPQTISLSLRINPSAPEPQSPAPAAATSSPDSIASSAGMAAADAASVAEPPTVSAPPPVTGAKGMLMQSIARASQLLHAPKLSLKVIRTQATTAARPAPAQDVETGKVAEAPAPSPEPEPAAPRQAATPKSDDLVLRDIEELLARQP